MGVKARGNRTIGPVDYLIVEFPDNKFSGKIAPEIRRLEETGLVRVLDVLFIRKDENGTIETLEAAEIGKEAGTEFMALCHEDIEWFHQDDVEIIGAELPNNSSVGAILFENLWAIRMKEAIASSGGKVISHERVPSELVEASIGNNGLQNS